VRGRAAPDVSRLIRRARRRHDGAVLAHGVASILALLVTAAALVALLACAAPALVFAAGAAVVVVALLAGVALVAWRTRGRWVGTRAAAAWLDRRAGLDGRLTTASELGDRGDAALTALLHAQIAAHAPRLAPRAVVPRVVPWRPLAATAVAFVVFDVTLTLAPSYLRRRAVVVASAGDGAPVASGVDVAADALAVYAEDGGGAPTHGAGARTAVRDEGSGDGFGDAVAALQGWLRQTLGADEPWAETDPAAMAAAGPRATPAPEPRRGRRSDIGVARDGAAPDDATTGPTDDGLPDAAARQAARAAAEAAAGGAGPGAGDGSDPNLFGAATTARGAVDRFELSIAARVRARSAGPQAAWDDAPAPEPDAAAGPVPAGQPTAPFHPPVVPPAWAGVVRRLYAHAPILETTSEAAAP
jgi:hypothetical protein